LSFNASAQQETATVDVTGNLVVVGSMVGLVAGSTAVSVTLTTLSTAPWPEEEQPAATTTNNSDTSVNTRNFDIQSL
jgi:hypothetical protein